MAKAAKSKTPAPRRDNDRKPGVTVHMFCHGLGDCFLITVPQRGRRPYSILIDCGIAMNTAGQDKIMCAVAAKIAKLTGDVVDVLAVTHEHQDHISGFVQAAQLFAKIHFRNVWLAWTENRRDKLAQQLKQELGKAVETLARARAMFAASNDRAGPARQRVEALDGVLAFHGHGAASLGAAASAGLAQVLDTLKTRAEAPEGLQYLKPGVALGLPGAESSSLAGEMKVYVLGPPHSRERMVRIKPSKKTPETYEKKAAAALAANWSWTSAVMNRAEGVDEQAPSTAGDLDRSQPFERQWRIPLQDAAGWCDASGSSFYQERYVAKGPDNDGRRIDDDWLWSGAQRLALRLESYTNNTSLVLAFELPRSKKVLLFAADAQVGNWLSWHDQSYPSGDGRSVTAEELLARTVLYKVGHHGSHNATLRERGLELMDHPQLTAMLPVEAESVDRLRYGEMPLEALVAALRQRCNERILQTDKTVPGEPLPGDWRGLIRPVASTETITVGKDKKKRSLCVEYTIED